MAFGDAPIKAEGQRVWVDPDYRSPKGMTANKPTEKRYVKPHDGRRKNVKGFNKTLGEV